MGRKWYQNIEIDGVDIQYEDPKRKDSKFWGEGKWNNFIKPLLPKGRTFIEIGCSAGLFLKMATDAGFKDVIGIDASPERMEQAELFKKSNKYNYRLIRQAVGIDFELDKLPLADVVLISNTHYYFTVPVFSRLVDELKNRARYCIIVGARARRYEGRVKHDLKEVSGYFHDWQKVKAIEELEKEGDPAPRKGMYGALFKGNLDILKMDYICNRWLKSSKIPESKFYGFVPALEDLFKKIFSGEEFDYEKTLYYKFHREKKAYHSPRWIRKSIDYKRTVALDIQKNGFKEPVYIKESRRHPKGKLLDGVHRMAILRELGYENVIIRKLICRA